MWSRASPLPLAAVIAMFKLSLILVCPMKPSKRRGRRLLSSGISSALGLPDIIRSILISPLSYLRTLNKLPHYITSLPNPGKPVIKRATSLNRATLLNKLSNRGAQRLQIVSSSSPSLFSSSSPATNAGTSSSGITS